jgi:putative flippase GtrA
LKRLLKFSIIRYFFVGGFAALSNLASFALFQELLHINYLIAAVLSFIIATLINYYLSIKFVFQSGTRFGKKHEMFWTYIVSLIGLALNMAILYICVSMLFLNAIVSQVIAIGLVFFWNYFARKRFVFRA